MSVGINIEHPVAHTHTQNGLAESFIKRLQLIARPLLMKTKLPTSAWGHAIMHAAALVRIRPTTYHEYSPSQLVLGKQPNISHLRIFGCAVYVPIAPTQRTKMGPQRRLGVYVGFDSPSIIRYLEPLTGDVFTARFADCHFNESVFPSLGREKSIPEERREISWKTSTMTHLDPRTNQCELEVQRIIHLQNLANQLPDAFIDTKKVTKSHIPAANTPARIDVPVGQLTNESKIRLKRGRPVGSKDVTPRKRRTQEKLGTLEEAIKMTDQFKIDKSIALEEAQIMQKAPEEVHIEQEAPEEAHIEQETPEDPHIEREAPEEAQVPENLASDIIRNDEDPEPRNVEECRHRNDWPKWKEAIQAELNSLTKREVFGPVVQTPEDVKPVGYKWVFVRKRNENNEIIRYKARLVAQGFSQRPGIDYEETYSPVMDAITFRFLISLAVSEGLDMRLMDVITAYLYGSMDNDIYMKIPEGFKLPANNTKPLYVDDLNLVGTPEELTRTTNYLKKEFEMKDLGKTKFCLGLQIEHFPNGVLVHQSTYIKKVLKRFYMDKAHPLSSPMVVRSLDVKKDPFRPCEKDEELLGPEVPYLSAIGALMYLANCTRPDIAFSVNLLARYSSAPTRRHWNGIKHILRYLRGTTDMGLFYSRESKQQLLGYADAGYLSDPHKGRSQTGYVFNCNGTAISWRSVKQTMVATSSNHSEILAIHEASRECIWLRSMIQHIRESCGLSSIKGGPTTLFEDNAACIAQITGGYIKGDRTKHISPKFFYTHELQKSGEIDVQQIRSSDNLADLFTKSLPTSTFKKLIHRIGMRQLKDIDMRGSMLVKGC
ncbi:Copia protein [Vitis vinifera]|uniref:Copia protein n=1 Tax=Vitis vinifera TaxID=29760 RepID=A0A438FGR3_VITVI|nr:Copia protein [Vitis vinifera]